MYIAEKICDLPDCPAIVVPHGRSTCKVCRTVRCPEHIERFFHPCGRNDEIVNAGDTRPELAEYFEKSQLNRFGSLLNHLNQNTDRILADAEAIRSGHKCSIMLPASAQAMVEAGMYTSINIHIPITFDDGVNWLLRVRLEHGDYPPLEIRQAVLDSEVVTLQLLKTGDVPVPNAWMPLTQIQRKEVTDLPIDYFFCEYLTGKALLVQRKGPRSLSQPDERIKRIIEGFAESQVIISNNPLPYNTIGCLRTDNTSTTGITVGPLLNYESWQNITSPHFPGPFQTNQERYLTQIDLALSHIENGYLRQENPLNAYLWHLQMRELVEGCDALKVFPTEVYIKHADDKNDIFMGDEEGNVTGIIDWEWAYVTTKEEAFSSPFFAFDRISFHSGNNDLSKAEEILVNCYMSLNRPDLADCVRNGRIYNRLSVIGKFGITCSQMGLLRAFKDTKPIDLKPPCLFGKEWTVYFVDRYKDNPVIRKFIEIVGWDQERSREEVIKEKEESRIRLERKRREKIQV